MRLSSYPDCSLYPPDPETRETGVRLDPTRLEGADYLALVQALEEGELAGATEWRSPSGRLLRAERIKMNGKHGVVWRDSTLIGRGRRAAYGDRPACSSQPACWCRGKRLTAVGARRTSALGAAECRASA